MPGAELGQLLAACRKAQMREHASPGGLNGEQSTANRSRISEACPDSASPIPCKFALCGPATYPDKLPINAQRALTSLPSA